MLASLFFVGNLFVISKPTVTAATKTAILAAPRRLIWAPTSGWLGVKISVPADVMCESAAVGCFTSDTGKFSVDRRCLPNQVFN